MKRRELQALLESRGLAPRASFGQNFLVDPGLLTAIPSDAGVRAGEEVLEVGPGAGALTAELLAAGARVLAVELDRGLFELLEDRFVAEREEGRLRLVHGDVLAGEERLHPEVEAWWEQCGSPRLVANLPYAISGPFLSRLPGRDLKGASLLLQREVALKALGREAAQRGPLSIRLSLAFHGRLGRRLPPEVFWPRPQIQSAFLHLEPRADAPRAEEDRRLAAWLRCAFGQRRKKLLPRMEKTFPEVAEALRAEGVAETARAEDLDAALWARILARSG